MSGSISKIYIDGKELAFKPVLQEDDYRIVLFQSKEAFNTAVQQEAITINNSAFVIDDGQLFLYTLKEQGKIDIIQITSIINTQMQKLSETFDSLKSAVDGFSSSLETMASGAVKIFPTFEEVLNVYNPGSEEVTQENELLAGSYIITLGRYSINDGGSAIYYVSSPNNVVPDGIFAYQLAENENCMVLVHDDHLNFLQLGGKANDRSAAKKNTKILSRVCAEGNVTLQFGNGRFYFHPTILNGENITIEGVGQNLDITNRTLGTVIAYEKETDDDKFLWGIGSNLESSANAYFSNISLRNLTFTSGLNEELVNDSVPLSAQATPLKTLLSLVRVKNGNFENLTFKGFQREGLRLASCVNSYFSSLKFQYGYCLDSRVGEYPQGIRNDQWLREAALVFGKELILDTSGLSSNVTDPSENLHFSSLFFKNIIGSCILFDEGCDVSSVSIENLSVDGGNAALTRDGTKTPWSTVSYTPCEEGVDASYVPFGAITVSCGSKAWGINIQNLKGKYFSSYYCKINNVFFLLDRILHFENPNPRKENPCPLPLRFGFSFDTITHQYQTRDLFLGEFNGPNHGSYGYYVTKDFNLSVGRFITDDVKEILFKTTGAGPVHLPHLGPNSIYNLKTNANNCVDYIIKSTIEASSTSGNGVTEPIIPASVAYETSSAAQNKLTARMVPLHYRLNSKNTDFDPALVSMWFPVEGNTFNLRLRTTHTLKVFLLDLTDLKNGLTVKETAWGATNGQWAWKSISGLSDKRGTHALGFIANVAADEQQPLSVQDDLLDIFYWN